MEPRDSHDAEFSAAGGPMEDPILALRGLGKEVWTDEDADDYVRRLRVDWR